MPFGRPPFSSKKSYAAAPLSSLYMEGQPGVLESQPMSAQLSAVLQHIYRLAGMPTAEGLSDGQLLGRFVDHGDESAFASLLRRHGPMVLGVCRRILRHAQDSEDAFQACFLILARKARTVRQHQSLGAWLYRVAYRLAIAARAETVRRREREREVLEMPQRGPIEESALLELQRTLDEELNRLPEKYRLPVVLCFLEGKTHEQAARELGWPKGTVAGRVARARERLRDRLTRRGLGISAGAALLTFGGSAPAVPAMLGTTTLRAAALLASGQTAAASGIATEAVFLAQRALQTMTLAKLQIIGALCLAVAVLGAGAGRLAQSWAARPSNTQALYSPETLATAREEQPEEGQRSCETLAVAVAPDSRTLATASGYQEEGGALTLWDLATGAVRARLADRFGVRCAAFSPDGKILAAGGWDKKVRLYEVATGRLRVVLPGHEEAMLVNSVAFSADGKILVSTGDKTVKLWDVAQAQELKTLSGHAERILGVCFAPDGKTVASACIDGIVKLWDVATGKEQASFLANQAGTECVAFSPDGKVLATAGLGGWACLWEAATQKQLAVLEGHTTSVTSIAFAPDGKTMATVSGLWNTPRPGELKLWDVATAKELFTLQGHQHGIWSVRFSPDGKTLFTGSRDQTVKLWEVATRQERLTLSLAEARERKRAAGPAKQGLSPEELNGLWTKLGESEAAKAYQALRALVRASDRAVFLIEKNLKAGPAPDAQEQKRVQELIVRLDHGDFTQRARAAAELEKLGESAIPALRKAQSEPISAEVRTRIARLLGKWQSPASSPEGLRALRAVEVLEQIGTPAAREALQTLAKGKVDSPLTQEAAAALERLSKSSADTNAPGRAR
jgi:RNA polymerase sigma factor (sigma-70 family)